MSKKIREYFSDRTMSYTIAICAGVLLFMAITHINVIFKIWGKVTTTLSPFIYAFALSYILNKPVLWFENNVFKNFKKKKAFSILVTYIIFLSTVTFLLAAIIPQLGLSISYLIDTMPALLEKVTYIANELVNNFHWSTRLIQQLNELWSKAVSAITQFSLLALPSILNFSFSVGNGVIKILMILIISVYMLAGKQRLLFQIKKATYAIFSSNKAKFLIKLSSDCNNVFSGFIMGKLIDSTIIGILTFIGMLFIYPPYTVLIAVVIGITNMIPFFGPFIGAIPCVFILLIVKPMTAFIFTLFIIALQQFDGNILGPKILGDSLGLSPIWVLVAILLGNGLFGLIGMLIGVPTFAVIYKICSEIISVKLKNKGIDADYNTNTINLNETRRDNDTVQEKI